MGCNPYYNFCQLHGAIRCTPTVEEQSPGDEIQEQGTEIGVGFHERGRPGERIVEIGHRGSFRRSADLRSGALGAFLDPSRIGDRRSVGKKFRPHSQHALRGGLHCGALLVRHRLRPR